MPPSLLHFVAYHVTVLELELVGGAPETRLCQCSNILAGLAGAGLALSQHLAVARDTPATQLLADARQQRDQQTAAPLRRRRAVPPRKRPPLSG